MPEVIIAKTLGPPKWLCRLCKTPFWDEGQFNRHLIQCYSDNEAEIQASRPQNIMPQIYGPERGDPELREYWRKNPPKD